MIVFDFTERNFSANFSKNEINLQIIYNLWQKTGYVTFIKSYDYYIWLYDRINTKDSLWNHSSNTAVLSTNFRSDNGICIIFSPLLQNRGIISVSEF